MSDELDFLDELAAENTPTSTAPVVVEGNVAPAVVEPTEPAKVDPVVESPVVSPSEPTDKEPKTVPLATFLDTLNENKELKRQIKAPAPAKEPQAEEFQIPDPVKNPKEYAEYRDAKFEFDLLNERMNMSEILMRQQHPGELIDTVRDWAVAEMDNDPALAKLITTSVNPYGEALRVYNERMEYKAYQNWVKNGRKPEEMPGKTPETAVKTTVAEQPKSTPKPAAAIPAAAAQPQPVVAPLPTSIADEPSSSGGVASIPAGAGVAFDDTFGT